MMTLIEEISIAMILPHRSLLSQGALFCRLQLKSIECTLCFAAPKTGSIALKNLLTYFHKKGNSVLSLFNIRTHEIFKVISHSKE